MARIATLLATQALPLARLALGRVRSGSGVRPDAEAAEAEDAPQTGFARTTANLARAVSAVGATLYDYSNGQYGLKPVDVKTLRHARKEAEREVEARRHAQQRGKGRQRRRTSDQAANADDQSPKRGGARWVLIGLGALVAGGAVAAVVILQREQLRAAATQALDRGRQTVEQTRRQLQARGSATP
jgi:hypothetical protein